MIQVPLLALVIFAILALNTKRPRNAVIYLGVFSLASAVIFLFYNAPDVALAEGIIGSAISTILFLVVLEKYQLLSIFYRLPRDEEHQVSFLYENQDFIDDLVRFSSRNELDPHVYFTHEVVEDILQQHEYALIVDETAEGFVIYGHEENTMLPDLRSYYDRILDPQYPVSIVVLKEEMEQ